MTPTNEDLSKLAKDAFYVTVGLGVMTVQKVQVRRREVQKHLGKHLENRVKTVEERLQAMSSHGAA